MAWWIALGFGHHRLPGLILIPLALLCLADAGRRLGVEAWRWIPALVIWTPLGLIWPVIVTPDTPLLVAWSVVIWATVARRPAICALALAACCWCKPSTFLVIPPLWWAWGARPGAAVIGGALALYAPHLWWSVGHGWLPFSFQSGRAWLGPHPGAFVAGQVALISPIWAWILVRRLRGEGRQALRGPRRALWLIGGSQIAAWGGLSLVTRVEPNWTALAWPPLVLLIAEAAGPWIARGIRWAAGYTLVGAAALCWALIALPPGLGPPRDGPGLSACLADALSGVASGEPVSLVSSRYQEHALLGDLSTTIAAPSGARSNEYLRQAQPSERAPRCGFVLLGESTAGISCAGRWVPGRACHRPIEWCHCP